MTPFMLYCWLMLDSVIVAISVFIGVAIAAAVVCLIAWKGEGCQWGKKPLFIFTIIALFLALALPLIPSTKQAAIIFGVPTLIQSAKGTNADKIPAKLVDYLNTYLDNEIEKVKK